MSLRVLQKDEYKFKRGDLLHLDDIYTVQGIGDDVGGQWWEHVEEDFDELVVTRDVHFVITYYK